MQSAWTTDTTQINGTFFEKTAATRTTTNGFDSLASSNKDIADSCVLPPTITINFDFLSSQSSLLPEDTQGFHDDLYSVEKDQLLPITSPFLVPGIYKKIGTTAAEGFFRTAANTCEVHNVFVTEQERHGRIITSSEFHNLYIKDQETEEKPITQQILSPKVVPGNNEAVPGEVDNFEALSKIAQDILQFCSRDHIVIDRKRNEVVRTDCGTNQKTIYRFLAPETLKLTTRIEQQSKPKTPNLKTANGAPIKLKLKLGRPRKKSTMHDSRSSAPQATLRKKIEPKNKEINVNTTAESVQQSQFRTRSGRIVKLLKPALISATVRNEVEPLPPLPQDATETLRTFLAELKDSDYHCNKNGIATQPHALAPAIAVPAATAAALVQNPPQSEEHNPPAKRRVPPESICPTCHKIFLGRRLQRHFTQHPDHMQARSMSSQAPPPPPPFNGIMHNSHELASANSIEQLSLFRFLIAKLQKSHLNEDQRAELFLGEINDLVEQLQLRSSCLIRNTSGLHLVTARCSRVLGIPEGQYALDMSAIEAPLEPETNCLLNFEHLNGNAQPAPSVNTRCLDYATLSMSLDDTLTDEAVQKLNLSAGGKLLPPSEESLMRAVEVDLGMDKLNGSNLLRASRVDSAGQTTTLASMVPHYDHASDNAVEAVTMKETTSVQQSTPILDLAVDFFQFNN